MGAAQKKELELEAYQAMDIAWVTPLDTCSYHKALL